MRWKVVELIV